MKLQKLVYIAYGWHLALSGKKLFTEEIEAWKHGPVVPSLYHEFKHLRENPITSFATSYDYNSEQEIVPRVQESNGRPV
ncbi:type II toxin-antitoxin system antitoxin SocA domain-containing protein [Planktotalea sp.]|uniref:Panacea domain-containing protein n=1 Tax=Planktotalea sp. TaxID=2029877 RepID=UPI00344CE5E2